MLAHAINNNSFEGYDYKSIEKDFKHTLNSHSAENNSNTPDCVLAKYLVNCLKAYDIATQENIKTKS